MTLARYLDNAPAPNFFELIEYETIRDRIIADLRDRLPSWDGDTSDPIYVEAEAVAAYAVALREYFNNRSRAQLLKWATGTGLRHIGASRGILQDPDEEEEQYRTRIELTPLASAAVGSRSSIRSNSLLASSLVKDAGFVRQEDLSLIVYVLSTAERDSDNDVPAGTPSAELISEIQTYLTDDERLGWAERLTVAAPTITEYDITATVFYHSSEIEESIIRTSVEDAVKAYALENLELGKGVALSALYKALQQTGVSRANIVAPAADLPEQEKSHARALKDLSITITDLD